jgi:hypothetical protein
MITKYNNVYGVPLYLKYFLRNHGYKGDIFLMFGPKLRIFGVEKTEEHCGKDATAAGYDPNIFGLGQKTASLVMVYPLRLVLKPMISWRSFPL